MNKLKLYPKLAAIGIRKNKRLYIPYILTCVGMVTMFYIISFLANNQDLSEIHGGNILQSMLGLGTWVVGIFALIFLFYTNSFLVRRRKMEFGLYNILGMGKRNIAHIQIWETLYTAAIALVGGIGSGIVFSKLAGMVMVRTLGEEASFDIQIEVGSIITTIILFAVIFLLILLNAFRQVHAANPVELLKSEAQGEKPPKANWIIAVIGAVMLAIAYYMAATIGDPVSAIILFFVAVIMVIIASYLLFTAGSVAYCKLLQKNKKYYYKTKHFVSVSSMVYRMKRNGAGLASICILSTMVLVMLSSTLCLYIGTEDSLRVRYPRNIIAEITTDDENIAAQFNDDIARFITENNVNVENEIRYRYISSAGMVMENKIITDYSKVYDSDISDFDNIRSFVIIPIADYNRISGENISLADNEILVFTSRTDYNLDTLDVDNFGSFKIVKKVEDFYLDGNIAAQVYAPLMIFVTEKVFKDYDTFERENYSSRPTNIWVYNAFDVAESNDEQQLEIAENLGATLAPLYKSYSIESMAGNRMGFYASNCALLFLGVMLSIVFIFASVLMIYYKQVTEGFEDKNRFTILQKVGMTQKEIKKTINSQVMSVFFMPLIVAGIHIIFAFNIISKLLTLFGLIDTGLLIIVTLCSYLVFAIFYVLIYVATSKTYLGIVSKDEGN